MAAEPGSSTSSVAALLRTWRGRSLLTQEQLASRAGLGVRTIRRLESDQLRNPRTESLRLVADALGLTEPERARLVAAARGAPAAQAAAAAPVPQAGAAPPVPRQLPADVAGFTGRADQLRRLDAVLAGAGSPPTAVVISAIAGTAGVGKTALAVHWAHRVADRFPDGQLYVNLRGFDPGDAPMPPAAAIRGFLDSLGVPPQRIPQDLDAQAALYRSLLTGRRVLLVLDNARDAGQVRPLLPGAPGCLAVVTSRSQLTGLVATQGAHPLVLDLLSAAEGRELLASRLGEERLVAEPAAAADIVRWCARLPLALAIAAARAATHPEQPLSALAADLAGARGQLDAFGTGDPAADVRAVFSWSYRSITAGAARLFRLLGLHPGPDLTAPAAASLAGLPVPEVRPLLAELTRAYLLTEQVPGRFSFHDLLRAYATELTGGVDSDEDRAAARDRLLDHYLHTAYAAAQVRHPLRRRFAPAGPATGVTAETFTDPDQALGWFTAEHQVLLGAVELAAATGRDRHAHQLAWCLNDFLDWRGHWQDWAATQEIAIGAAGRLADPAAQALAHRGMAGAHVRLGDYPTAHHHLSRALDLLEPLDGRAAAVDRSQVHMNLASVCVRQGRPEPALGHARQCLDLCRGVGDRAAEGDALHVLGWVHGLLGDHQQSLRYGWQALASARDLGNREGEAATLDSLGQTYHQLGDHSQATECYQYSLDLCRALGNRYYEANGLVHLGDVHDAAGDPEAAHRAWKQALEILDELGHPEAEQVRAKLGR